MKKTYAVTIPVLGFCTKWVEAENEDEAIELAEETGFSSYEPEEHVRLATYYDDAQLEDFSHSGVEVEEDPEKLDIHNLCKHWKLYWVVTFCHSEDWFVLARTKKDAEEFHEAEEGMDPFTAGAKLVRYVDPLLMRKEQGRIVENEREAGAKNPEASLLSPHWPSSELLRELGGKFLNADPVLRVVQFDDSVFTEGSMQKVIDSLTGAIYIDDEGKEVKADKITEA
jgi:hypothetical protein